MVAMQQIMVGYVDQCKTTMPIPGVWLGKVSRVPYSRKFSLVQIFAEMRPYPSEEIFAVFIFTERKRDALTTPLPDDGHAPHVCVTEKMTLNNEARQGCATTAYSSLCVEALAITKVSRPRERGRKTGLLNRRIQHC